MTMYGLSVNEHGVPECEYCHEPRESVRPRPVPDEAGIPLCAKCWRAVQQRLKEVNR